MTSYQVAQKLSEFFNSPIKTCRSYKSTWNITAHFPLESFEILIKKSSENDNNQDFVFIVISTHIKISSIYHYNTVSKYWDRYLTPLQADGKYYVVLLPARINSDLSKERGIIQVYHHDDYNSLSVSLQPIKIISAQSDDEKLD